MKRKLQRTIVLCGLLLAAACTPAVEEKPQSTASDMSASARVWLLNEGSWGANNASITRFDNRTGEVENDWFARCNGRGLGDLAQDMVAYGSKVYVTVSESGSLEVVDTASGRSQRVDLGDRYPRYLAACDGKLYVSCYNPHSVIRIDTASLEVEATCSLGDYNPEGMAVAGQWLMVASSNASDSRGVYTYDSVLYAIDLATFAQPQRIAVGCNPQRVAPLDDHRVVVNYWGDYGMRAPGSAVVDVTDMSVKQLNVAYSNFTIYKGQVYGYVTTYSPDYSTKQTRYVRQDVATLSATDLLADDAVKGAYSIAVDPANGDLLIASDGDYVATGTLYCFDQHGNPRWHHAVGMFPSRFVFI